MYYNMNAGTEGQDNKIMSDFVTKSSKYCSKLQTNLHQICHRDIKLPWQGLALIKKRPADCGRS